MVSTSDEQNYLYLGIGFIGLFVFVGLALSTEKQTSNKDEGPLTLNVKTTQNTYVAEVSEEKLFSKETTVLFSPLEKNQNNQPIQCSINCVK